MTPARGDLGYRLRGNRCEGLYVQELFGDAFWLASLTVGQRELAPWSDQSMLLRWSLPAAMPGRLRGISLPRDLFYRMDVTITGPGEFRWPADVRAALRLKPSEVGVVVDYELHAEKEVRRVYVPVEIQPGTADAVHATLLPGDVFRQFIYRVYRLDSFGRPTELLGVPTELPGTFFPPTVPLDLVLRQLPPRSGTQAMYRLDVNGTTRGGGGERYAESWWLWW